MLLAQHQAAVRKHLTSLPGSQDQLISPASVDAMFTELARIAGPAGTPLTDTASQTIQSTDTNGGWRQLPTLSQNGTLTLGAVGANAGDTIEITRTSNSAFTYAVVNGGVGAGTMFTMAASKLGYAKFQFDGTNWALRSFGVQ